MVERVLPGDSCEESHGLGYRPEVLSTWWDQELHHVGRVSRREGFGSLREGAIIVGPLRPTQKCEGLAGVFGMLLRVRKILLATHIAGEKVDGIAHSAAVR